MSSEQVFGQEAEVDQPEGTFLLILSNHGGTLTLQVRKNQQEAEADAKQKLKEQTANSAYIVPLLSSFRIKSAWG